MASIQVEMSQGDGDTGPHEAQAYQTAHVQASQVDVSTIDEELLLTSSQPQNTLLTQGIDPNRPDAAGQRALHAAAENNHLHVVQALLDAGADPSLTNQNGLIPAAVTTDINIRRLLFERGLSLADCVARGAWGELKRRILARKIDNINLRFGQLAWTLLGYAAQHNQHDIVTHLLNDARIDVNAADLYGTTPLHAVAIQDNLVAAGADTTRRNLAGQTPADVALPQTQLCMLPDLFEFVPCARCNFWYPRAGGDCSLCPVFETEALIARVVEIESSFQCVYCNDNVKEMIFACGHEACRTCVIRFRTCPGCNTHVTKRIRRFGIDRYKQVISSADSIVEGTTEPVEKRRRLDDKQDFLDHMRLLHEVDECEICLEATKAIVFQCGHETCTTCAAKLTNCPQCRVRIKSRIQRRG
ncbi:E3 ubiquitin-protein ligase mib2 [Aphanomyces cochlioides]|nr:E3 ubiquitin-protein ligase mib2 [Aphanomyces cochlioides]